MTDRIRFTADDDLLRQVITDQAGDWKKGLLELTQNAFDSYMMSGKKGSIKFVTEGKTLVCEDNGIGWGDSKEEIIKNMSVFGNSIKRGLDNTLGHKGMGRGQAFTMIYNPEKKDFDGSITIETNGYTIYDISLSDLSFSIKKGGKATGCRWTIQSNFRDFDTEDVASYLEQNIILPIKVWVNSYEISSRPTGKLHETDDYAFWLEKGADDIKVYERGLFVKHKWTAGYGGTLVSKKQMKLNFARNDIQSGDPVYKKCCDGAYATMFGAAISANRYTVHEKEFIKFMLEDGRLTEQGKGFIEDIPFLRTCQNKWITPREAKDYPIIILAGEGNRTADKIIEMGMMCLTYNYENSLKALGIASEDIKDSENDMVMHAKTYKYEELDPSSYDGDDARYIDLLHRLVETRDVRLGINSGSVAWTDGDCVIWVASKYFNKWKAGNPTTSVFLFRALETMAHEMGHENDNRDSDYHGVDFYEGMAKWTATLCERAANLASVDETGKKARCPRGEHSWFEELEDGTLMVEGGIACDHNPATGWSVCSKCGGRRKQKENWKEGQARYDYRW